MKVILGLFLVVRLLTVSRYPHFFDGPEYVRLAGMGWSEAMRASHLSVHPVSYMVWSTVHNIWPDGGVIVLSMVSVAMGLLGFVILEEYLRRFGKKAMWIGGLAYILWPLSQLLQTNVTTESVTQTLLVWGVYGWWKYWNKKGCWWVVGIGGVAGAIVNFPGIIWWVGLLLVVGWWEGKMGEAFLATVASVGVALGGLYGVYSWSGVGGERIMKLWEEHGKLVELLIKPGEIVRVVYQASRAFVDNYGFGAILAAGWLVKEKIKNGDKRTWGVILGIGAMYVVSMSYWHGGVYGRPGGVMIFVLSVLLARAPWKIGVVGLGLSILAWAGTVRAYQATPIPQRTKQAIERECGEAQLVVISDLMRPQLTEIEGLTEEKYTYIGPENGEEIIGRIEEVKKREGEVCVTQEAWDYPYRQYDGQRRHPLQGRKGKIGELAKRIKKTSIKIVKIN